LKAPSVPVSTCIFLYHAVTLAKRLAIIMESGDDALITLDEAAKLIPGASVDTLRRLQRRGLLTCYRIGKPYLTTRADVREAVKKCAVGQKVRKPDIQSDPPLPLGLTSMDLSRMALDAALTPRLSKKKSPPVRG
jgi:excisionase family DNA binding protein